MSSEIRRGRRMRNDRNLNSAVFDEAQSFPWLPPFLDLIRTRVLRRKHSAVSLSCSGIVRLCCLGFLCWLPQSAFAQPPQVPVNHPSLDEFKDWGTPKSGSRAVAGISSCYYCHSKSDLNAELPLPPGITGVNDDGWVMLNELQTWTKQDRKHYQAYSVLLNERSQKMAKLLGIVDPKTQASLVHQDARCLACHSAVPANQFQYAVAEKNAPPANAPLLKADTTPDTRFNLGVSCEACHGPSGSIGQSVPGWGKSHWDDQSWRMSPPQKKFDEFGFWNVRSPVTRAKICLSCHLGNVEQGKVITHAMYAAGHPPLPSFELAEFVDQEPRHWRYFSEKSAKLREEFCAATGMKYTPGELQQTQASLAASLVAAGEMARLTANLIDPQVKCPGDHLEKPHWPELANFACFACHHDLKRDGWRQNRPRRGPPGRPSLNEWPSTLAEVAADFLGKSSEFNQLQTELDRALLAQPFGRPEELQQAARKYAAATEDWAQQIAQRSVTQQQGQTILDLIATKGAREPLDYDSARQLVWAYGAILRDIESTKKLVQQTSSESTADVVDRGAEPEIHLGWMEGKNLTPSEKILKGLSETMVLDLRAGEDKSQIFRGEKQPRPQTEVQLEKTLPKIAEYDPAAVQAAFQKLLELSP